MKRLQQAISIASFNNLTAYQLRSHESMHETVRSKVTKITTHDDRLQDFKEYEDFLRNKKIGKSAIKLSCLGKASRAEIYLRIFRRFLFRRGARRYPYSRKRAKLIKASERRISEVRYLLVASEFILSQGNKEADGYDGRRIGESPVCLGTTRSGRARGPFSAGHSRGAADRKIDAHI